VEKSPVAEIGLAKRQKTVRQKGKIRTDTNHPISFQGEALRLQGEPSSRRRAVGRKRRALQERKPTLEHETTQGGLRKAKERL
jgi:hypothetical protein